jgi:hypothetical protein
MVICPNENRVPTKQRSLGAHQRPDDSYRLFQVLYGALGVASVFSMESTNATIPKIRVHHPQTRQLRCDQPYGAMWAREAPGVRNRSFVTMEAAGRIVSLDFGKVRSVTTTQE